MLHLTGAVVVAQGNGFIMTSLDLAQGGKPFDASRFAGLRIALKGNGERYVAHLRTVHCVQPWQYYEAEIETNGAWQIANAPFQRFSRRNLERPLDPSQLVELSLAASDRSFKADLMVAQTAFYEGGIPALRNLSSEEESVIAHKGTERPFSGRYVDHSEKGTYTCKRCGSGLFRSSSKFNSDCGWPSFDEAIEGATLRLPDADGVRTEIVCFSCGAHLGHVFMGEGFTEKSARHCVNSISLGFRSADPAGSGRNAGPQRAIFASGCFWGTEHFLRRAPGVLETTVGFTGGHTQDPTYREVCAGATGHAEAVEVVFDPSKTSYETLARLYFETHDFTQVDRQGPDVGTQYRTEIFYLSEEQKKTAEALIGVLRKKGHKVATKVAPAGEFWPAEDGHQDYYEKSGKKPYCHSYRKVF
jgi:peptide methionine sulfoxide reductase msrA/msrB